MLTSTESFLAAAELAELRRREHEAGIVPEPALDRFMDAMSQQACHMLSVCCSLITGPNLPLYCYVLPDHEQFAETQQRWWASAVHQVRHADQDLCKGLTVMIAQPTILLDAPVEPH